MLRRPCQEDSRTRATRPGNLTQAGPSSGAYVFDAENHLTSAGGVNYTYDGDGNRAIKSNGTIYWYGASGGALEESDLSGNLLRWYYFFNGERVARSLTTNEVGFYLTDHLGNVRYLSGASTGYSIDYFPYGGIITNFDTGDDRYQFTGKERDAESGLDNFGARFDSSSIGRFVSPDWSSTPDPVPYSDTSEPETLNLYAYAGNNPLAFADPDGHSHQECQTTTTTFTDPDGTVTTTTTTNCKTVSDWWDFFPVLIGGVGHHLVSEWSKIAAGEARNIIQKTLITGALKDPSKNYYTAAHRAYNAAVRQIVKQMEKELGKDISKFSPEEVAELAKRILNSADSAIQNFLDGLGETRAGVTARQALQLAADVVGGIADATTELSGLFMINTKNPLASNNLQN